jgi:hydroxymethylpyrimidine pyrophosphatase-like HAD family hydrolase
MGVAMANAIEEAKAVANYITLSNDEDGVAHFLEQILA